MRPRTRPPAHGSRTGGLSADQRWMRLALRAARAAERRGEVPVGAILVRGEELLARGANRTLTACDPSAHAEVVALRRGARRAGNHRLTGATLYVTLEPCPMCLGALTQARVDRLVYGADDPKAGGIWLLESREFQARTNHRFQVTGGVLADEAGELLREFFRRRRAPDPPKK